MSDSTTQKEKVIQCLKSTVGDVFDRLFQNNKRE